MRCLIPERDLNQRLNETVCRWKGSAVRVKYVGGKNLELVSLSTGKTLLVTDTNDPYLDISGVPLGYVQLGPSCVVYTSRKPLRIYKQGVTNEVLSVTYLTPARISTVPRFNVFSKQFENMVNNVYPTLESAFELLKLKEHPEAGQTEIALSREIALKYEHKMQITHVYFKGEKAGFIIKDSRTVITPSDEMGWVISKYLSSFNWKVE